MLLCRNPNLQLGRWKPDWELLPNILSLGTGRYLNRPFQIMNNTDAEMYAEITFEKRSRLVVFPTRIAIPPKTLSSPIVVDASAFDPDLFPSTIDLGVLYL